MLAFTDPDSDWDLWWISLTSDWLSVVTWHDTAFSLVIGQPTLPSDWPMPDWPQIVANCTEQVSPHPQHQQTPGIGAWSMVLTALGVIIILHSHTITFQIQIWIEAHVWVWELYLNDRLKRFSHDFTKRFPQNTWFVIFQTLFVIRVLKVSTLIDPSHYGTTSWFDIGFTTSLIVYNLTSQLSTLLSHDEKRSCWKFQQNLTIIIQSPVTDPPSLPSFINKTDQIEQWPNNHPDYWTIFQTDALFCNNIPAPDQ